MTGIEGAAVQVGVGGIFALLVLDRVIKLAGYIKNGKNGRNGKIWVGEPVNQTLRELFETMRLLRESIDKSNSAHRLGMQRICEHLEALTGEVKELKGRVSG